MRSRITKNHGSDPVRLTACCDARLLGRLRARGEVCSLGGLAGEKYSIRIRSCDQERHQLSVSKFNKVRRKVRHVAKFWWLLHV
jgi:hypothetical protein